MCSSKRNAVLAPRPKDLLLVGKGEPTVGVRRDHVARRQRIAAMDDVRAGVLAGDAEADQRLGGQIQTVCGRRFVGLRISASTMPTSISQFCVPIRYEASANGPVPGHGSPRRRRLPGGPAGRPGSSRAYVPACTGREPPVKTRRPAFYRRSFQGGQFVVAARRLAAEAFGDVVVVGSDGDDILADQRVQGQLGGTSDSGRV